MRNKFDPQILEAKAEKFREKYGLGRLRSVDFETVLRDLKVLTVFKSLEGSSISGMALKHAGQRFILVNSDQTVGRQHFTIAHELYHLFVQENFTSQVCSTGRFAGQVDIEERNADWFAAHLLMPHHRILAEIPDEEMEPQPNLSLRTVVRLEQEFQCSRMALLIRLESMRLIDARRREELSERPAESARKFGFSTDLYFRSPERESIGDYADIASQLLDKDLLSETHYANLLLDFGIDINANSPEYNF